MPHDELSNFLLFLKDGTHELAADPKRSSLTIKGKEIETTSFLTLVKLFINSNPNLLPSLVLLLKQQENILDHIDDIEEALKTINEDKIIIGDSLSEAIQHGKYLKKQEALNEINETESEKRIKEQVHLGELGKNKRELREQLLAKEQALTNELARNIENTKKSLQASLFTEISEKAKTSNAFANKTEEEKTALSFILAREAAQNTIITLHSLPANDFSSSVSSLLHQNLDIVLDKNGIHFDPSIKTSVIGAVVAQEAHSLQLATVAQQSLQGILNNTKLSDVVSQQQSFYKTLLEKEIKTALGITSEQEAQAAQKELGIVTTGFINSLVGTAPFSLSSSLLSKKPQVENAVERFKKDHQGSLRIISDLTRLYNRYSSFKDEPFFINQTMLTTITTDVLNPSSFTKPQALAGIGANAALYTLLSLDDVSFTNLKTKALESLQQAGSLPKYQRLEQTLTSIQKLYILKQAELFRASATPQDISTIKNKLLQLSEVSTIGPLQKDNSVFEKLLDIKLSLASSEALPSPVKDIFVAVSERQTVKDDVIQALNIVPQEEPPLPNQDKSLSLTDSLLKENKHNDHQRGLYTFYETPHTFVPTKDGVTIQSKQQVRNEHLQASFRTEITTGRNRISNFFSSLRRVPTKPATAIAKPLGQGVRTGFSKIATFLGRSPLTFGGGLGGAFIGTFLGGFPQGTFAGGLTGLVGGSIIRGGLIKGIGKEIKGFTEGIARARSAAFLEGLFAGGARAAVFPEFAVVIAVVVLVLLLFVIVIGKGGINVNNPTENTTTGGDISQCLFTRGGDGANATKQFKSKKLLRYIDEASQLTTVPSVVLAAFMRVEFGSVLDMNDEQVDAIVFNCPVSSTGALGIMQIQPKGTTGHDAGAVGNGAKFARLDYDSLTTNDYCDPQKALVIGAGFILYKLSEKYPDGTSYGDGTKWDPAWTTNENVLAEIARRYYGCREYGGANPNKCEGPYDYGKDLITSVTSCKVTTPSNNGQHQTAPPPPEDLASAILNEFGIVMTGYDRQHLVWAWEKLWDVKHTRFLELAKYGSPRPGKVVEIFSRRACNPGESSGCGAEQLAPDSFAVTPYGVEELFKVTLTHELGHAIQLYPPDSLSRRSAHQDIYNNDIDSTYGKGVTGYGATRLNEDYAEMIAYYLNPNATEQTSRSYNRTGIIPYGQGRYPLHYNLAKEVLGEY